MNTNHTAAFFNFEKWGEEGKQYVKDSAALRDAGITVEIVSGVLDKDHVPANADFDIAAVFSDCPVDAATIAALPNLKYITTMSTGFDHIDLKAAVERGIPVSSVPGYGENTVAEFAFALILALSRKVREASARVEMEHRFATDGLCGFDLQGKTLGVIGTGRIGKHSIRIAKGLGMNIVAYDVYHDDAFAKEMGFDYLELNDLLAKSDVITIHAPYLPSTHHLINTGNVDSIKQGAYLVNTARGAIVETAAIRSALKSGRLAGAGIDVIEEEAQMKAGDMAAGEGIIGMPNVIVTPHNAFNTREAYFRILDTTIGNIVAFAKGAPVNVVKTQ